MYTSFSVSKRQILVHILVMVATQLLLMSIVSSLNMTNAYIHHTCSAKQGEYKPGSHYEKILNSAIQELSKDREAFRVGYVFMGWTDLNEVRFKPEMVYITFQCRGDTYGPKCRSCFATARSELGKRCPRNKGAIIWYDHCLLEFSSINTAGKINYDDNFCINTERERQNAKSHTGDSVSELLILLENLTSIAVSQRKNKDKPAIYAAGEKRLGNKKIYVMVQCTGDLNLNKAACQECVEYNVLHFEDCYENKPVGLKRGATVLGRSCNFRFERYPFVNAKTSPNYLKF